ncbi:Uncharacterized protein family UPF0503 [Macleaya cordata]|uniref:Uncharacterized protein family UPF0503 n=1 Tax=Macleaya cordata TaxID=56857 RepID=A0A200QIL2_MACCD|nr:Uncharacterized protein family UPF0503 [Macleaya cordata]
MNNLELPQLPPHRLSTCERHPEQPVTGFCASCLRERLAGLDPANRSRLKTSTSSTATSALKAIFRGSSGDNHNNHHRNNKPSSSSTSSSSFDSSTGPSTPENPKFLVSTSISPQTTLVVVVVDCPFLSSSRLKRVKRVFRTLTSQDFLWGSKTPEKPSSLPPENDLLRRSSEEEGERGSLCRGEGRLGLSSCLRHGSKPRVAERGEEELNSFTDDEEDEEEEAERNREKSREREREGRDEAMGAMKDKAHQASDKASETAQDRAYETKQYEQLAEEEDRISRKALETTFCLVCPKN